jgi:hypothetical protein
MVDVSGVELVYDSTERSDSMINGGILGGTNSIYFTSSIVERARGSRTIKYAQYGVSQIG